MVSFTITGNVGGEPVNAVYEDGLLLVDGALLEHARLVVVLGDTFTSGSTLVPIKAAISGDPAAMLLTLLRACDDVAAVEIRAACRPRPPARGETDSTHITAASFVGLQFIPTKQENRRD